MIWKLAFTLTAGPNVGKKYQTLQSTSADHFECAGITFVLARLEEQDFALAQTLAPGFRVYRDYDDWLDERCGWALGLAQSGVDIREIDVSVQRFIDFQAARDATPDVHSLDEFAAVVARYRDAPCMPCMAELREAAYERWAEAQGLQAAGLTYASWVAGRARAFGWVTEQPHLVAVDVSRFLAWAHAIGTAADETALDAYAGLFLEFLAGLS